ncbi:sulfatase-like hydrolase/transferase [Myxococcota bacterium]|nr:sulfatase-like hydrolase/transferase [Myxococcota bacterium]
MSPTARNASHWALVRSRDLLMRGSWLLWGSLFLWACTGPEIPEGRRNILLLTVDTLRADHLSRNGYDRPTTPFLDALVAEGVIFESAVTPSPRTTQSIASLFTGVYPPSHGVRTLFGRLRDDLPSLPELARARGYRTVAVVSNHILGPERGLARGFDVYDHGLDTRDAKATTRTAIEQLERTPDGTPLFIWVHYIDPHVPYFPPPEQALAFDTGYEGPYALRFGTTPGGTGESAYPPELGKVKSVYRNTLPERVNEHIRRLYAAEIRYTDNAIAELVTRFKAERGPDWLIVFAADHGEELGAHGLHYDHGDSLYESVLRVPLAIILPRNDPAGGPARVDERVSLVDVLPTLVELLDLGLPAAQTQALDGRSLLPHSVRDTRQPRATYAESGRSFYPRETPRRVRFDVAGKLRSVTLEDHKLIYTPGLPEADAYELYQLSSDPNEQNNLYRVDHPALPRLRAQLDTWLSADPMDPSSEPDTRDVQALRELGYLE